MTADLELAPIAQGIVMTIRAYYHGLEADAAKHGIKNIRLRLESAGPAMRAATIDLASHGATDTDTALLRLDAIRWLRRVSYHTWRIMYHCNAMNIETRIA